MLKKTAVPTLNLPKSETQPKDLAREQDFKKEIKRQMNVL